MNQLNYINDWESMPNKAIVKQICAQLRALRLSKNVTQTELSEKSGLGRVTISRIERGGAISLLSLVQILRGLNELDILNAFDRSPEISPMQLLKEQEPPRYRASKKRFGLGSSPKNESEW
jgi:transcriptional regulator with XRE-family HTH domain